MGRSDSENPSKYCSKRWVSLHGESYDMIIDLLINKVEFGFDIPA